jgi:hypothetical protein
VWPISVQCRVLEVSVAQLALALGLDPVVQRLLDQTQRPGRRPRCSGRPAPDAPPLA